MIMAGPATPATAAENKAALRIRFVSHTQTVDPDQQAALELRLQQLLVYLRQQYRHDYPFCVGLYDAIQTRGRGIEPRFGVRLIASADPQAAILLQKIRWAWPVLSGAESMFFRNPGGQIRPGDERDSQFFTANRYGIYEPAHGESVVPDVLVVPGLAFSRDGWRLGRGGGFYDRYLAATRVRAIGVAWLHQLQPNIVHEPWDRRMDWVLTAGETLTCNLTGASQLGGASLTEK